MKIAYKITYPNGKIYIGKDPTDNIAYFRSPDHNLIAADFTRSERNSFTVTREILWESDTTDGTEVSRMEVHFIRLYQANNPAIGYNRWPLLKNPR